MGAAEDSAGLLSVVATPIGHAEDLSDRGKDRLSRADVIAAEDTRVTRALLRRFALPEPDLLSCHEHNERERIPLLLRRLRGGARVVLVSDAGTPSIHDPGDRLVAAVADEGHPIEAVPGPSAVAAALSVAGLSADRFFMAGYLPRQAKARREAIEALRTVTVTLVLYEAPHRLLRTLEDLLAGLGDRHAALICNLTKAGELVRRTALSAIHDEVARVDRPRGEMTLVIEGATPPAGPTWDPRVDHAVDRLLEAGLSPRTVRDVLADVFGVERRPLYRRILDRRGG